MSNNKILKIIISAQIIMLLLIIFGISDSYNILRWDVLIVTIIIALFSISSRRYYWGIIFIIFAILFNPIDSPSLSKTEWVLADIFLIFFLIYWSLDYFWNYRKGLLFERFTINKFPMDSWILVDHTKDLHKKFHRFVESDSNPDFTFRKKINGKIIAVECKYHSIYWNHKKWGLGVKWNKHQGERYLDYSHKNNIPVYIAIGVSGNPSSPKIISFIPLEIIQKEYYKFIPKKILEIYQKLPTT